MTTISKSIELKLPCVLTERELQSRSMMLVETISAVDETMSYKRETMKGFDEKLTALNETQRDLARTLRTGVEQRMIACTVLFHTPAEATKRIVRMDTGEVVKEEAMSEAECQLNMFSGLAEFESFMKEQAPGEPGDEAPRESNKPPDPDAPSGRPKRPRPQ